MTADHFNSLSPGEAERLAMLAEECAEVIQVIGKILRHGYESRHPSNLSGPTNAELLSQELCDVDAVWAKIKSHDEVPAYTVRDVKDAWERKLCYAHHQ